MLSESVFIRIVYAENKDPYLHLLIFSNTVALLKTALNVALFPGFQKGDVFILGEQGFQVFNTILSYLENKHGTKTITLESITYYVKATSLDTIKDLDRDHINDSERINVDTCLMLLDQWTGSHVSSMLKQPDIDIWMYLSVFQQEKAKESIFYLRDHGFILITWVQAGDWGGTYINIASTSKLKAFYK
ncbi:hypothetical protein ATL39_3052 [Sinobaca qinghaiensis]|uniref:Uncharacterized protein n=1 Tax=Sinobaca qinghaiensis TaxID=342944 RepID=A0A419UWV9_9BACL|nr:hypothetical protein [Sinobaca qinghaiensis]RKD69628.1 hypothetical protein ATL39_3052 [Sinobaca qinghaiensis]